MRTVGVDGKADVRELALHLEGFVANLFHRCACIRPEEALRLTLVSPAQHTGVHSGSSEQADEIFRVGGLACSAHGEVADANDGQGKRGGTQDTAVKEGIAQPYSQPVEPGERIEGFVYLHHRSVVFRDSDGGRKAGVPVREPADGCVSRIADFRSRCPAGRAVQPARSRPRSCSSTCPTTRQGQDAV